MMGLSCVCVCVCMCVCVQVCVSSNVPVSVEQEMVSFSSPYWYSSSTDTQQGRRTRLEHGRTPHGRRVSPRKCGDCV